MVYVLTRLLPRSCRVRTRSALFFRSALRTLGMAILCMHVHSIDRLARNAKDLLNLVEQILAKGATVSFNKNNLIFSPEGNDHMAKLQLTMLAAFAEFERELIRERQREGIAIAKAEGKYSGRRKISEELLEQARARTTLGEPLSRVAKDLNVSRETLYKYGIKSVLPFGNHIN